MMTSKCISLARDFTRDPGPRRSNQGPFSGEAFRKVLLRALKEADYVTVDLDGTNGIGSSFIDEAFGGLISREGIPVSEVRRRVTVKSLDDESYLIDFEDSIQRASPE
jgi:STAS-like domain of unknown function (DUF4325)